MSSCSPVRRSRDQCRNRSRSDRRKRVKKPVFDVARWSNGGFWHENINTEHPWHIVSTQDIEVVPTGGGSIGSVTLVPGQTIDARVIPINSNPATGPDGAVVDFAIISGAITSNVATVNVSINPLAAGITSGMTIVVQGFSAADSWINGAFSISAVTATSISFTYPYTRANAILASSGFGKVALQTGTPFVEELWLCNREPGNNNPTYDSYYFPVAAASAGGNVVTLAVRPFSNITSIFRGTTNATPMTLRRVRTAPMYYGATTGMMDDKGHAVVKCKYACNRQGNFGMYLLLAEMDEETGEWSMIENVEFADGSENLRLVDERQMCTWKLKNLKQGKKYTAMPVHVTNNLFTMIKQNLYPVNSAVFRAELSRCNPVAWEAVFRMPYPKDDCRDIRIIAGSCAAWGAEDVYNSIFQSGDFDMLIDMGDTIYTDYGGSSVLSFNYPNNAGLALGFAALGAYHIYPTATGLNAIAPNTVISSSNNVFTMDGVRYLIPSGTYATATDLMNAFASLIGPDFTVSLDGSSRLVINRPYWSSYGYSEFYTMKMRGLHFNKVRAMAGCYMCADDHEVFNNYQSLTREAALRSSATPIQQTISTAMNSNRDVRFESLFSLALPGSLPTLIPDKSVDAALKENDRYTLNRFVETNERHGSVRWGDVELIKLDSIPYRNSAGKYEYYNEEAKYIRTDQLEFLFDRLKKSDAKVKIVLYSRTLAPNFLTFQEREEQRKRYVEIAVGLGYNAADAESTYNLVHDVFESNFFEGYKTWAEEIFYKGLQACAQKNVFFITGGDHYATLNNVLPADRLLDPEQRIVEVSTSSFGTSSSGGTRDLMRVGRSFNTMVYANSRYNGYSEIIVSPKNGTVTISFRTIDGGDNTVEFPIL